MKKWWTWQDQLSQFGEPHSKPFDIDWRMEKWILEFQQSFGKSYLTNMDPTEYNLHDNFNNTKIIRFIVKLDWLMQLFHLSKHWICYGIIVMNIVHHPGLEKSSLKPCERKVVFYHSKCQQPIFISLKTMLIVNYCVGHFSRNNIRHSSKKRLKHCAQSLGKRTENPEKLRNLKAFKSSIL